MLDKCGNVESYIIFEEKSKFFTAKLTLREKHNAL